MKDYRSLKHSKWYCKYHVVWIPKYRKKVIYSQLRKELGPILHELARQRECVITATSDPTLIGKADVVIVAVPTPFNEAHQPELTPLISSSETVSCHMKEGAVVIYESTVVPEATEDICALILE
jgi:UDP-N-acetyl-D-mannosaminuronate dehydrogenase